MRVAGARRQCRFSKKKCTSSAERVVEIPCDQCEWRHIRCSHTTRAHSSSPRSIAPSVSASGADHSGADGLLSKEAIADSVELYLRFIHDKPHSLFHRKELWSDIHGERISECLLMAICSMGSRFAPRQPLRSRGPELLKRSSVLFSKQLEVVSLSNVQTCILLANLYAAQHDNKLEALYFGIGNRMAQVLGLHKPNVIDPPIMREVKCRVWWSLFMAERWCPPALGLPRGIPDFVEEPVFPMDEATFQRLDRESPQVEERGEGMWKFKLILVNILGPVQDLNLSLAHGPCDRRRVDQQVLWLSQRLEEWKDTLPGHMILNEDNLNKYQADGQAGTFVAMHFGYYHYSTLLYFQYLDACCTTWTVEKEVRNYANQCRYHALSFSRLLQRGRSMQNCHVVYLTVSHMILVSSAVLLHTFLFSEQDDDVETARTQLTCNFDALVELKQYWPHVESIIHRLFRFQHLCLQSMNEKSKSTYRMDRWMIRFIMEYALPFEESAMSPDMNANAGDGSTIPSSPSTNTHHDEMISPYRTSMLNETFANLGVCTSLFSSTTRYIPQDRNLGLINFSPS